MPLLSYGIVLLVRMQERGGKIPQAYAFQYKLIENLSEGGGGSHFLPNFCVHTKWTTPYVLLSTNIISYTVFRGGSLMTNASQQNI